MKYKLPFSSQTFLAIMATTVSICALVVSVMQTYYQHRYLHASSWPHIQIDANRFESGDSTKNYVLIKVTNKGIGPAIIESVVYEFKGKKFDSIDELTNTVLNKSSFKGGMQPLSAGVVIGQNEEIEHLKVMGAREYRQLLANLVNIKMTVIYQSVHGERWEYIGDASLPNGRSSKKL